MINNKVFLLFWNLFYSWDFSHFHRLYATKTRPSIPNLQPTKYAENRLFMPWQNSRRILCGRGHTMPNVPHLCENCWRWGKLQFYRLQSYTLKYYNNLIKTVALRFNISKKAYRKILTESSEFLSKTLITKSYFQRQLIKATVFLRS